MFDPLRRAAQLGTQLLRQRAEEVDFVLSDSPLAKELQWAGRFRPEPIEAQDAARQAQNQNRR